MQSTPNNPKPSVTPALHLTISEDLHQQDITQRLQEINNCEEGQGDREREGEKGENSWKEGKERKGNFLMEGLRNVGKDVTRSEMGLGEFWGLEAGKWKEGREESIPQPLQSDQQQSNQAQYLSYFQNPIPQPQPQPISPCPCPQPLLRLTLPSPHHTQFLSILYQTIIYLRKQQKRTEIDDQLLADRLVDHLVISTRPEGRTQIGRALLGNGYFLCGYALVMGRINRSEVLFRYVLDGFGGGKDGIQENLEEFLYYCGMPNYYFQIPTQQPLKQTHRHPHPTPLPKRTNPPTFTLTLTPNTRNHINQNNNKQQQNKMKSTKITNATSTNIYPSGSRSKSKRMRRNGEGSACRKMGVRGSQMGMEVGDGEEEGGEVRERERSPDC